MTISLPARWFSVPLFVGMLLGQTAASSPTNSAPAFEEVRQLIKSHLIGVTDESLNAAAVTGLLDELRGKARLIQATNHFPPATGALAAQSTFDGRMAYLRFAGLDGASADKIRQRAEIVAGTNGAAGLILDLRFAQSDDYAAAAAVADLFLTTEKTLLEAASGPIRSRHKTNALTLPVIVLVNNETSGAPEALAAILRETGAGLILGNTTRGAAAVSQVFPLQNGDQLQIATGTIKLGDGSVIPATGIKPDIEVAVSREAEKGYLRESYEPISISSMLTNTVSTTATNRPARRTRLNEADLVRARRDGVPLEDSAPGPDLEPAKPVIRDPALARAIDLLKGLSVVRQSRR